MTPSFIELSDDQIIQGIKSKYEYHRRQSERYKGMLTAYGLTLDGGVQGEEILAELKGSNIEESGGINDVSESSENDTIGKPTFHANVLDILKEHGRPMTVNELNLTFNERTGKSIPRNSFSSKLSLNAKNLRKIRMQAYPKLPIEQRYWWGLSEWFSGNDFKSEYRAKIVALPSIENDMFNKKTA